MLERVEKVLFLQKEDVLDSQLADVVRTITAELPNVVVTACGRPEDVPQGACFDAVIAPTLPWLPSALSRLESYHWLHLLSAGVEKIWDMPFHKEGLLLTKSSGIHASAMSEFVLGAMLHFAKSFDCFVSQSQERLWQRIWLDELDGRTVAILGMGSIGSAVAARAKAFGMNVIGIQRTPREVPFVDQSVGIDSLRKVLPYTNYLVVCVPLTTETRYMIDIMALNLLPLGSVLVDVSRGGVVQEAAVINALGSGRLRGVALDVFEQEPLRGDSPLWNNSRVLLTPHVAGTNPRYMERAIQLFVANAKQVVSGGPPLTPVDTSLKY